MAPTEISMALQIEKWPHIFSTSGATVPTTSFAFLGPAVQDYILQSELVNSRSFGPEEILRVI